MAIFRDYQKHFCMSTNNKSLLIGLPLWMYSPIILCNFIVIYCCPLCVTAIGITLQHWNYPHCQTSAMLYLSAINTLRGIYDIGWERWANKHFTVISVVLQHSTGCAKFCLSLHIQEAGEWHNKDTICSDAGDTKMSFSYKQKVWPLLEHSTILLIICDL